MVGKGIPYFPLANKPLKKGKRVNNTHTQPKISPIPDPRRPSLYDSGCIPTNFDANAIKCSNTTAVPIINSGDSLNANFPTLQSSWLTSTLDSPLGVTSNTDSEIPKSFKTRLKIPKAYELVIEIISTMHELISRIGDTQILSGSGKG